MRVAICGAGIGGLALARGLVDDGHEVTVLERRPRLDADGAAITLYSNGLAAAHGLGVDLADLGAEIRTLDIRRVDGRRVLRSDLTRMTRRFGFPVRTIPRRAVVERLAHGLPVEYDSPVAAVDASGPSLRTVDDRTVVADVVVGADGYRSAVRAGLDMRELAPAVAVGWTTWQALSPVLPDIARGDTGVLVVGAAGLVGVMPAGDGLCQWWFDVRTDGTAGTGGAGGTDGIPPVKRLRRDFAAYAEPVPQLLAALTDTELGRYPHVLHEVNDHWGTGSVTLLGDAAHAFPPSQAQGANQALEDAWLLRRGLAVDGDRASSLRRYEQLRARRVRLVSRMAASERTNQPAAALTAAVTRRLPPTWAGAAYARLLRRFSSVLVGETV